MTKMQSLADLKAMRDRLKASLDLREKAEYPEDLVQIRVAMGTCGIAAGAKQLMEYMMQQAEAMGIDAVFTQTGCIGQCQYEPTVEVILPRKEGVVFGKVDNARADQILGSYIAKGEEVEGIIPTK